MATTLNRMGLMANDVQVALIRSPIFKLNSISFGS